MAAIDLTRGEPLEVVVVGGGQAGLAVGYRLSQHSLDFAILDAGPQIGHVWTSRWGSLRLFTPAEFDGLPGVPFPALRGSYPTKDDVAAYLRSYVERFALPVVLNTRVMRLQRDDDDFSVMTSSGVFRARQVIVATGPFRLPSIPSCGDQLDPQVPQVRSSAYRNPGQLPSGRVLVVGAANSGLQIAGELHATHHVTVAVGSRPPQLPQRMFGRDLFHWLTRLGLMKLPPTHRVASRLRAKGDPVIGGRIRTLRRHGVELRPRLASFTGRTARFADGTSCDIDAVVWATGYRSAYDWLDIPSAVADGQPVHNGRVSTTEDGLFLLGLPWQTSRGSALLGFVADDAAAIAARVATANSGSGPTPRPTTDTPTVTTMGYLR